MINEGVQDNEFVQKNTNKKLPQIRKKVRKSSVPRAKKVVWNYGEQKSDKTALRENNKIKRAEMYKQKVSQRSNINILKYVSSKEKVTAQCNSCGHEWMIQVIIC